MDLSLEQKLNAIAETVFQRADSYQRMHDALKRRAVEIYFAFVGQFMDQESEGLLPWQSRLYTKAMKPKIMAAWSQFVQGATSAKEMWNVEPRGVNTPQSLGRAKAMKAEMHEQAQAIEYHRKLKSGSMDMFLYGAMFMQCPIVETMGSRKWVQDLGQPGDSLWEKMGKRLNAGKGNPQWRPEFSNTDYPSIVHRNYFEMFPWPYSSDPQAGEAIIHRPFIDRYEMQALRDMPGYYGEIIDELLKSGEGEAPSWSNEQERMSARGWNNDSKRKGYDLVFHAGKLSKKDLENIPGFEGESGKYTEALAWCVDSKSGGKKTIKLVVNPVTGRMRPFMVAHYEQMPFESVGTGIGENSVDIAKAIAGGVRLFLDGKKMALPMVGINTSYFGGAADIEFSPFKIWEFEQNNVQPKDFMFPIQFNDITQSMIPFIEVLERLHDEITSIPKWTTGVDSKMLNKTATGISMIMNASSQMIRGAIENIDDHVIGPSGQRFYDWNMENNPRNDIKGDFIITPNGITTLMQKESIAQQLLGLVSLVVNPQVMQNPYALRLLRIVGDNMGFKDVDSILPDPDEMEQFAGQDPRAAAQAIGVSSPEQPQPPSPQEMMQDAAMRGLMKGMEKKAMISVSGPGNGSGEGTAQ